MARTSKSWRITHKRRRSKKEIEDRRKAALLRRAGYRDAGEIARMLDEPGIPINKRGRPALQVCVFSWGVTDGQPAVFNTGGGVYLMTAFPTGPTEYQRHTNTTITYKMLLKMRMWTDSKFWGRCMKYKMYWWLVYDSAPTDRVPLTDGIFDRMKANSPGLWLVKRELCHRFVVKKNGVLCSRLRGLILLRMILEGRHLLWPLLIKPSFLRS